MGRWLLVNWLLKFAQIKDMPLPFEVSNEHDRESTFPYRERGHKKLENKMRDETAGQERLLFPGLSWLGSGVNGVAGQYGNRVYKYTKDYLEAVSARKLMRRGCPCVPKIHSVVKIQSDPDLYRIESDRVQMLTFEEKCYYYMALVFYENGYRVEDINASRVRERAESVRGMPEFLDVEMVRLFYPMVRELMLCLGYEGLDVSEASEVNIAWNGDRSGLLLIDFGGSLHRDLGSRLRSRKITS